MTVLDRQRLNLKTVAALLVTVALLPVRLWCQEGLEEEERGSVHLFCLFCQ